MADVRIGTRTPSRNHGQQISNFDASIARRRGDVPDARRELIRPSIDRGGHNAGEAIEVNRDWFINVAILIEIKRIGWQPRIGTRVPCR